MHSTLMKYQALSASQHARLLEIELPRQQVSYVGDIHGGLHSLTARPVCDIQGYAVLVDDIPRGFFLLKRRTLLPPWASGNTATLHALMIDHRHQGLGLGRECLARLPAVVREGWPEVEQLMLAVETDNEGARRLYLNAGWQDVPAPTGTALGRERLMLLKLR